MLYPLDWVVGKIKELEAQVSFLSAASQGASSYVPLSGATDPEGVAVGLFVGQTYLNTTTNALWAFNGTPGTNTGWV